MRTLSSVESAEFVTTKITIGVTPVDQSTTYTFSNFDINNLTPISYEIDFLGGFGKSSTYQVTLSSCADFFKTNFKNFIKAEVALTVTANSDEFTPHIGVVQDIYRFASDPNLLRLQIFDKFFDNVPKFPAQAIVDCYNPVHPEVSNNEWGYPAYYGQHARPFYMTPVDCNLASLVGPINVSSENHVTSLYFNRDQSLGTNGQQLTILNGFWNQQSGSTNLTTNSAFFEIDDLGDFDGIWRITGTPDHVTDITSEGFLNRWSDKFMQGVLGNISFPAVDSLEEKSIFRFILESDQRVKIQTNNKIIFGWSVTNTPTSTPRLTRGSLEINSGFSKYSNTLWVDAPGQNYVNSEFQFNGELIDAGRLYQQTIMEFFYSTSNYTAFPTVQFSCNWNVSLKSENYQNYSVFGAQVNCSDIAISENPIHILTDIFSQVGISYLQDQASQSQLDTSSYQFQCYFGQREPLTDIAQEFGTITGTYIYISDSGQTHFRSYQESDTASIDLTLTSNDYLRNSLVIRDNPLGTTVYDTAKAKRINIDYNYNFTLDKYENVLVADPTNTAACNSIAATGINKEYNFQTKYVLESDTASIFLGNLLRKRTKDEQIIECALPGKYLVVELADVIKLEHPLLENSESLYQVTKLKADYLRGQVNITANELINL